MQRATELDLPFLDIAQSWFAADPYPHFAAAREKHPWLATSPVGYLVNDYMAIREFFHSEEQYAPPYGGLLDVMKAHGTRAGAGSRPTTCWRSAASATGGCAPSSPLRSPRARQTSTAASCAR